MQGVNRLTGKFYSGEMTCSFYFASLTQGKIIRWDGRCTIGASLHRTGLVLFRLLSVPGYRHWMKEEDEEEKRKTKTEKPKNRVGD